MNLRTAALITALAIPAAASFAPKASAQATPEHVPVELALLVDTSGSVDESEYQLQQQGYVNAFRDAEIQGLIAASGGIAVSYIEWSSTNHQSVRVPWRILRTATDCLAFADEVEVLTRENSGSTIVSAAIEFALAEFTGNGIQSDKQVIDISGDGPCKNHLFFERGVVSDDNDDPEEYGTPWAEVMATIPSSTQVNGISIGTNDQMLDFYTGALPQGPSSFVLGVESFADFSQGIRQKLVLELSNVLPMFD